MDDLIKRLRTGPGVDSDTGELVTDEEIEKLAPGIATIMPSMFWMRMVKNMRAVMIEAANELEKRK